MAYYRVYMNTPSLRYRARKSYGRRKSGGKRKKIMETIIMETKREIEIMKGGREDEDKKRNYDRKKEKESNMKEKWQEGVELTF